jgi:hypothetical protein
MRREQQADNFVSIRNQSERPHIKEYMDMPLKYQGNNVISEAELLNFSDSNVDQDFAMGQNPDEQFDEDEDCISRDNKQAPFILNESKIPQKASNQK